MQTTLKNTLEVIIYQLLCNSRSIYTSYALSKCHAQLAELSFDGVLELSQPMCHEKRREEETSVEGEIEDPHYARIYV